MQIAKILSLKDSLEKELLGIEVKIDMACPIHGTGPTVSTISPIQ